MRRFVKTVVQADGYEEVRKVGERYVIHMEPVSNGDGSVTCYECMTDDVPDMAVLGEELKVWKEYIAERELETAKSAKQADLDAYDQSDAVNGFDVTIGGQTMSLWIDRETRADYKSSIEAAELLGRTEVHPVFNGIEVTLSVQMAKMALAQVQLYANQCFGVTERHRAAIQQLTTVADVEAYDFTTGYPERLTFSV